MKPALQLALSDSIHCLKHNQYVERILMIEQAGLLPAIPDWKIKQSLALHLWQDSIQGNELRTRLRELRHQRPDKDLHSSIFYLHKFLNTAPSPKAHLHALYRVLKPRMVQTYKDQARRVFPVNDAPTLRLLEKCAEEEREQCESMISLIGKSIELDQEEQEYSQWEQSFQMAIDYVLHAMYNNLPVDNGLLERFYEQLALEGTAAPILPVARCARPKAFKHGKSFATPTFATHQEEVIFHFSNYVHEMQAAETICGTMYEIRDMSWEFYYDVARHLWDEVRHSTMGEVRLMELGVQLDQIEHMVGNYEWRQAVDPVRRYVTLTLVIEANAFGLKNARLKAMMDAGDFISAQSILYDITDETMHVQYGHKWTPELIKHMGWTMTVDELVDECMEINAKRTLNPTQRFSKK